MRLLNASQARAVADAMAALNNVGGLIGVTIPEPEGLTALRAWESTDGGVVIGRTCEVEYRRALHASEWFPNQAAFMAAYGLTTAPGPVLCESEGGDHD